MNGESLSVENFFRDVVSLADDQAIENAVAHFVDELVAHVRREVEKALPEDAWPGVHEISLKLPLAAHINMSEFKVQNVKALEDCYCAMQNRIESEQVNAQADGQRQMQLLSQANEFCCYANKNRPSADALVQNCSQI